MPRVSDMNSQNPRPTIGIYSYGTKTLGGAPASQFDFDVSKWRDPQGQKQFSSARSGRESDVRDWVGEDARTNMVIASCLLLANDLIKPHPRGDKTELRAESAWLSFAFHDYTGKWQSVALAELVADALDKAGYVVAVRHHNLQTVVPVM